MIVLFLMKYVYKCVYMNIYILYFTCQFIMHEWNKHFILNMACFLYVIVRFARCFNKLLELKWRKLHLMSAKVEIIHLLLLIITCSINYLTLGEIHAAQQISLMSLQALAFYSESSLQKLRLSYFSYYNIIKHVLWKKWL